MSEAFLLLRMEVEPYIFKPKQLLGELNIHSKVEDLVKLDLPHAECVVNNN